MCVGSSSAGPIVWLLSPCAYFVHKEEDTVALGPPVDHSIKKKTIQKNQCPCKIIHSFRHNLSHGHLTVNKGPGRPALGAPGTVNTPPLDALRCSVYSQQPAFPNTSAPERYSSSTYGKGVRVRRAGSFTLMNRMHSTWKRRGCHVTELSCRGGVKRCV